MRSQAARHHPSPADNAGDGLITAMAIETFAPPMAVFRRGAISQPGSGWSPATLDRQASTFSESFQMGQRHIRGRYDQARMAIARLGRRKGAQEGTWPAFRRLGRSNDLLGDRPRNKMACSIGAMPTRQDYRGLWLLPSDPRSGRAAKGTWAREEVEERKGK